jgi:hypothetical protein
MTFVTGVDEQGRALITRWHRGGARLITSSTASRALVELILGEPLPEPSAKAGEAPVSDRTWLPFRASFLLCVVLLLLLRTVVFPVETKAAILKPETVIVRTELPATANADRQDRVRPLAQASSECPKAPRARNS